jgi:DDE family transposase
MARVSSILARIASDLEQYLPEESVLAAFRSVGHEWRERQLGPVRTLHLFLLQVLACNTAMAHLRHLAGGVFSLAGYCQARARLPLSALQVLLRESSQAMRAAAAGKASAVMKTAADSDHPGVGLWHGLRAFLVDGSSTITPDTPDLQEAFGQPGGQKPGCGFPVPKLLALFDAFTGMVVEMLGFPLYTHEQSKVWMLHPLLQAGDLLVGDRGFCSFIHLAMLQARGVHGCFRCHQRQIVDFRPGRKSRDRLDKNNKTGHPTSQFVRRLGKHDQIVRWKRPPKAPDWMTPEQWAALPEWLEVRELRYTIPSKGQRTHCVTIATTLLDETLYPKADVAALYGLRWRVETRFSELKTTLKMRKLKSKSPEGAMKELAVYCLVYNMVRAVTTAAGLRQKVDPERISFIDALRWLLLAEPGVPIPDLIVNPLRPNRHEPRVVKDRDDTYTKMTHPRNELRKALKIPAQKA